MRAQPFFTDPSDPVSGGTTTPTTSGGTTDDTTRPDADTIPKKKAE